ncbi:glycosyltransferase [Thalassoglobus sp.]|uniref:glycosyltransferase n=1 Tax=Thalassoglobus sp. TaxID=2795869 RepID=UPI003AA9028F
MDVDVSFVIPARDEELLIAATIQSIASAVCECQITSEVIVANDASKDATAEIAKSCGAKVVDVELHNIGAVRNAGAEVATGRIIFFLDADTQLPAKTLAAVLLAVENGAVGGGASVEFDEGITWFQRKLSHIFLYYWQGIGGWAAGCSIYVLRSVFEEIGGFDPQHFAAEERFLSEAIRRQGKFVIVKEPVLTSARKLRIYSTWHLLKVASHAMFIKRWKLRDRSGLEILYDAPREKEKE